MKYQDWQHMHKEATNKKLVPVLRFPEFRNDGEWGEPKLGAIAHRIDEKVGSRLLQTVSITAGFGFVSQAEKFSRDISGQQYKNYILLKKGDFAYNKGNSKKFPQGCIYKLTEFDEVAAPNAFICFQFNGDVVSDFYRGFFDSNFHGKQLQKFITSGARMDGLLNISTTDFFSIVLPTPRNKKEQQKIADCLSSLDELIDAENQRLDALKEHKKGMMQQLFPAAGEKVPKLRFAGFDGEWEEDTLGGVATFINGRAYKQEELLDTGKYRVLRVGNFFSNNHWYYSDLELDDDKYCVNGDLLYAWSASFGPRIWLGEKTIYHYHIWKVVEKKTIEKPFLLLLLDYETERIKSKQANGLGLLHITKGAIEAWKCIIPKSKDEQRKIADCLSSIDEQITTQTQKIEQLKEHKKGLMQQLFPSPNE